LWLRAARDGAPRLSLFFDSSVDGLGAGSPVKVRGVTVGKVARIALRGDKECRVLVELAVSPRLLAARGLPANLASADILAGEIARGLRAKLAMLSPATGEYYIEIMHAPETPARFAVAPEEGVLEVPLIPPALTTGQLDTYADKLLAFSRRDFAAEAAEWDATLERMLAATQPERAAALNAALLERLAKARQVLADPQFPSDLKRLNELLAQFRGAAAGSAPERLAGGARKSAEELRETLERIRGRATALAAALDFDAAPLREVRGQINAIREWAEWLRRDAIPRRDE